MKVAVMPETETLDDARLVERGLNGDRDAFGQLVARYQSPVCALAYSACGNVGQSEDLAQETFVIAWRKLADLKEPSKFKSWLYGIARNLLNNMFRRQTRNPLTDAEPLDEGLATPTTSLGPLGEAISKEELAILWRALERVPPDYREPLVLYYREQQSIEQVASTLELSEEAARQRLSRGRKMLQEQVIAFVEGALGRTGPGPTFTLSVLAALPAAAISAKTALGAAAKGGLAAKVLGLGLLGAVLTPMLAMAGMWFDYGIRSKSGLSRHALRRLKVYYVVVTLSVVAVVGSMTLLMSNCQAITQTHPGLFAGLLAGLILGYPLGLGTFAWWWMHPRKMSAPALLPASAPGQPAKDGWEYRSRFTFLGLPLVHIRFGNRHAAVYDSWFRFKPVVAWVAIGDAMAFGGLFAYAGLAVAPISVGGCAIGLLGYGAMAIGAMSVGGFSFGIWADGAFAFGWQAFADCAVAWNTACGGQFALAHDFARATSAHAAQANNDLALKAIFASPFFAFCGRCLRPYFFWLMWIWAIPMMTIMIAQGWRAARDIRRKQKVTSTSV